MSDQRPNAHCSKHGFYGSPMQVCPQCFPSLPASPREETIEEKARRFRAISLSTSALRAGATYRSFLGFMDKFFASGFPKGVIEFSCPEVMDLQKQNAALRKELETLNADYAKIRELSQKRGLEAAALRKELEEAKAWLARYREQTDLSIKVMEKAIPERDEIRADLAIATKALELIAAKPHRVFGLTGRHAEVKMAQAREALTQIRGEQGERKNG